MGPNADHHFVDVCACGAVVLECKCMDLNKTRRVVCEQCPRCKPAAPDPVRCEETKRAW